MLDIGGWMLSVFGPYGGPGVVAFVFLIFFIDAVLFPTLPELFFIIGFTYDPTPGFGLLILASASLAEVAGVSLLYAVVEKVHVPQRIKSVADRYAEFLIVSDERMLLVNRVAPMIPFAGAFVSLIGSWRLGRALFYVVLGCVLKYGAILMASSYFYAFFSSGDAQTFTLAFVVAVMALSLIAAAVRKRREGLSG